jgi:hypothetical protein
MFAVYSNNAAPGGNAYMNVMYGNAGYPMLGTFDVNRHVSARSVVANTGDLRRSPIPGWVTRITGTSTSSDEGRAIATDPSGNVIVTGFYSGPASLFNAGGTVVGATLQNTTFTPDVFIAKYSSAGTVLWATRAESTATDGGYGIASDISGNVFVTGLYNAAINLFNPNGSTGASLAFTGGRDVFIAKYSSDGFVSWATRIAGDGATAGDEGRAIATDPSGNVLVTGIYSGTVTLYNNGGGNATTLLNTGGFDVYVAKYSSDGILSWATRISSGTSDNAHGIVTDTSGNVFVTGEYSSTCTVYNAGGTVVGATLTIAGTYDCYIVKYSPAGTVLWATRITSTNSDGGRAIAADTSGDIFVTGQYQGATTVFNANGTSGATLSFTGGVEVFIVKYRSDGVVLWATRISSAAADIGLGIATDTLGNAFVTGYYSAALTLYNANGSIGSTLPFVGGNDVFIAKYSSAGFVTWAARITATSTSTDTGYAIATDTLGNAFVTGEFRGALTVFNANGTSGGTLQFVGGNDIFIAKYSPDGFISIPTPANSNVLVGATYASSVFSPFVNGIAQVTLPGTTLATTGIFICGPAGYFSGTLSELIIYARTLTTDQRQQVEGYLARKWGITLPITHPYYAVGPFMT